MRSKRDGLRSGGIVGGDDGLAQRDLAVGARQIGNRPVATETASIKGWIDNILIGGDNDSGGCGS